MNGSASQDQEPEVFTSNTVTTIHPIWHSSFYHNKYIHKFMFTFTYFINFEHLNETYCQYFFSDRFVSTFFRSYRMTSLMITLPQIYCSSLAITLLVMKKRDILSQQIYCSSRHSITMKLDHFFHFKNYVVLHYVSKCGLYRTNIFIFPKIVNWKYFSKNKW